MEKFKPAEDVSRPLVAIRLITGALACGTLFMHWTFLKHKACSQLFNSL